MLYMLVLQYAAEQTDSLREFYEQRGIAEYGEGVLVAGAWVAKSRRVYILFKAQNETCFLQACSQFAQFGEVSWEPVVDVEQI